MIPAFMATPAMRLRGSLAQHLCHRLIELGVEPETAVQCGIHFGTMDELLDSIDGGCSIILFTATQYCPELQHRDTCRSKSAELRSELGLAPNDVHGVDIAPMIHYLRGGAALN